jgi:hypothetical protein
MRWPHLFEFMDLEATPQSLRSTLREILECGNNRPFRPYYEWAADQVLRAAKAGGFTTLVELGAGTAPITRLIAEDARSEGLCLVPCDLNPDRAAYEALAARFPGKVVPHQEPVDFGRPRQWPPRTLLYLSGTFHHIPPAGRDAVIRSLTDSAGRVMVFEPLRKTAASVLFVIPSIVPALLLPLWMIGRPGRLRRFLWCWLVPVAPLMFWWEGIVSCLRMWTDAEWHDAIRRVLGPGGQVGVTSTLFCQSVSWEGGQCQPAPSAGASGLER